jgi:hypothetical protein
MQTSTFVISFPITFNHSKFKHYKALFDIGKNSAKHSFAIAKVVTLFAIGKSRSIYRHNKITPTNY